MTVSPAPVTAIRTSLCSWGRPPESSQRVTPRLLADAIVFAGASKTCAGGVEEPQASVDSRALASPSPIPAHNGGLRPQWQ